MTTRTFLTYAVTKGFRRPHSYETINQRGTVVDWDTSMRMEDNRGLLFAEGDLLVVSRAGSAVGTAVHCRTLGRDPFAEIEAPTEEQVRSLIAQELIVQKF